MTDNVQAHWDCTSVIYPKATLGTLGVMKIFFDVDGVLIDGWHAKPELRKPWNKNIETDLGVNLLAFEQLLFIEKSHSLGSVMDSCVSGQRDLKEALREILPQVGYRGHVDDFVQYWFQNDSNICVEVLDLVKTLKRVVGMELFVATGQEHYRAAYLWNELGFSKLFDEIFYSADIGCLKSNIRFFESINSRLGITEAERPLFFDDREDIVLLARQAGWDAVTFHNAQDIRSHPAIYNLL